MRINANVNNHANNHTDTCNHINILAFQNLQDLWSRAGKPVGEKRRLPGDRRRANRRSASSVRAAGTQRWVGSRDGCTRTFTRESRCASHTRLEKVDPDVPRSHAVGAATMLLGQGHALACGEPNASAKPRPAPPGAGLGDQP
jgi:hypothetical protein